MCVSNNSLTKEGYVQKEIKKVLDKADEKPDGTIFVIPLKIEECDVPRRLNKWQWVNYFGKGDYSKLVHSLKVRREQLGMKLEKISIPPHLFEFVFVQPEWLPVSFWISKYPVTNAQYERFINTPSFLDDDLWIDFPHFQKYMSGFVNYSGSDGLKWLKSHLENQEYSNDGKCISPRYWQDANFGISNPFAPVVGICWFEANAYCKWVFRNWKKLGEAINNPKIAPEKVRLPTEDEWVDAMDGDWKGRWPWDGKNRITRDISRIVKRCNVKESEIGHTTPVDKYPLGASRKFNVMDMAGNVLEVLSSFDDSGLGILTRGCAFNSSAKFIKDTPYRGSLMPNHETNFHGFRLVIPLFS